MEDFSLKDYFAIFLKWRKLFFITFFSIFAGTLVLALTWSNYRSSATIEIKTANVALQSGSDKDDDLADFRINRIEKEVTSTESLISIIKKFDLYGTAQHYTPPAALADRMRNHIRLDLIGSSLANPAAANKATASDLSAIAFTLSFDYSDPQVTKLVTDELVSRFIDEDLKRRRELAQKTSSFLATQIAALEAKMAEQEKTIADFKSDHPNANPDSFVFTQHTAASLDMSLQSIESQLLSNEGTHGSLMAQLATLSPYSRVAANGQILTTPETQLKALETEYAALTGQYGPDHPDVIRAKNQLAALRSQLGKKSSAPSDTAQLKAQIVDLKTKIASDSQSLGANNPDVVTLKNKLSGLESQLKKAKEGASQNAFIKKDADNPAYVQIVSQLNAVEAQRNGLMAQREALLKQKEKIDLAIAQNPEIEKQMAALTRDLEVSKDSYRDLKEKKIAADMAQDLDRDQGAERLVIINPPDVPSQPKPSRPKILLAGLFLAVLSGLGVVTGAHLIHTPLVGAAQLTALVGVAPLAIVPHLYTQDERALCKIRKRTMLKTSAALFALIVVFFIFRSLPIDTFWNLFLNRFSLS